MIPPRDINDFRARFHRAEGMYSKRNQLVLLCNELYSMRRDRASTFLGDGISSLRNQIAAEYHEVCARPHNVINVMSAVLGGYPPIYKAVQPGNVESTIPSRAELFLQGVWQLNSRRQQLNLFKEITHRAVRDGAVGIRTYWTSTPPAVEKQPIENPDEPGQPWVVQHHDANTLPIYLEIIDISKLFPMGKGKFGRPFTDIFYAQKRTAADVLDEWAGQQGADVSEIEKNIPPEELDKTTHDYIEWWGQDAQGLVYYAISFSDWFIISPQPTQYPSIPFVIAEYIHNSTDDPTYRSIPFLFGMLPAIEMWEYLKSRQHRQIDMYTNMNPYSTGDSPVNINATWGNIPHLPNGDIKFPRWEGQPPDVLREIAEIEGTMQQGTFSDIMFGEVSTRLSGFALQQIRSADVLRSDTPKDLIELALSTVADLIFAMMRVFSPDLHLAVVLQIKNKHVTGMLSGNETRGLVVNVSVKPKTSDEPRMAMMGAQLASIPNSPVSVRYILETFFGISQPEEEIARKLDEDAQKDPLVKLLAVVEVLREENSPMLPIVEAQLTQAMGQVMQLKAGGMPTSAGVGLGMPQATMGNPPLGPQQESEPGIREMMLGGPTEGGY